MTKKRIVSALLAVCMVLTMLPLTGLTAFAAEITSGDFEYEVLSEADKTCEITDYTGSATTLIIPSQLDGYTVIRIGDSAFFKCDSLTSVTIPNSVTSIGWNAFYWSESLSKITIPDTVTSIEEDAFLYTAYYYDTSNWKNDVLYIGKYCVDAMQPLSGDYTINSGTKCIAERAFDDCEFLESVTIPESVTNIGDAPFSSCSLLTNISVSGNNPNYKSENGILFSKDKTKLIQYPAGKVGTTYTIPDSVTSIGNAAFSSCTSLTNITLGNNITCIEDYTFEYCDSLTSVTIPDNVTSVGFAAFRWCGSLTSVTIPPSVTNIGGDAFIYCDNLTIYGQAGSVAETYAKANDIPFVRLAPALEYEILSEEDKTCKITGYNGSESTLIIPSEINGYTITSIASRAFYECDTLTKIEIPSEVNNIEAYAFVGAESLAEIEVSDSNPFYSSENGVLYSKGKDEIVAYPVGKEDTSFSIPGGVTKICDAAFFGSGTLKNITIPDSVTNIGMDSFAVCVLLESITIPDSVTKIGEGAFRQSASLKNITLPDNVISIGFNAFDDTAYYNDSSNWQNDTLYIGRHFIKAKNTLSGAQTIKEGTITIAGGAFSECQLLTAISLPNSVKSIGEWAFSGCSGLTSVMLNNVNCLETGAFISCSSLESIIIPDSVTNIGDDAFAYCNALKTVTLPDSVKSIGDDAFYDCAALTSITVKNRTMSIGDSAFDYCDNLTISGYTGSTAETYATENDIPFVTLTDGSMYMVMPESAVPGETVDIPVYVEGADLGALQFTVEYDADELEYIALTEDAFEANAGMTVANAQTPGALTVASVAGSVPAGKLYVLQFRVKDTAAGETDMTISFEAASDDTIEGNTLTLAGGTWTLPIANTYTVRYDANGGSGAPSAQTKVEDQALTLSSTTPTRAGYTFLGWSSDASAASSTYAPGGTYTANADVTLYAVWKANAYTVVYNANGGNGTMSNSTHTYDTAKALSANQFTRTGYTFLGWSESDDATSPTYTDGQSVRNLATANGATVTAYAVWEKDPVTVTSISVAQQPTKTEYLQNEAFSAAGLTLRVAYSDGTSQTITSGFTVSTPDMATPGEKTVTVTYAGKTTSFIIHVQENTVTDPDAARVYAESVTARPGETIQIPLYVENNPGVAYVKFKVAYDSDKLDLISAEDQGIFKGIFTTSQTIDVNPYVLQWMNAGNATGNGCFVMLTFKVLDDAAEGDVSIQITYDEAYNETLDDVAFTFTNPTVTIRDYTPGDINDDGVVNGKDGIILSQYLAEWGTEINLDAADVNGDGVVNGKDSIILSQYLAAWDVELGK